MCGRDNYTSECIRGLIISRIRHWLFNIIRRRGDFHALYRSPGDYRILTAFSQTCRFCRDFSAKQRAVSDVRNGLRRCRSMFDAFRTDAPICQEPVWFKLLVIFQLQLLLQLTKLFFRYSYSYSYQYFPVTVTVTVIVIFSVALSSYSLTAEHQSLSKQDTCSKEHRVCPMPRSLIS